MAMINVKLEDIFEEALINAAITHMEKKKTAPGVDKMSWSELAEFWEINGCKIREQIYTGKYKPSPAKKVLIDKPGKKEKRALEIPCVLDRMLLYAVQGVLAPHYEQTFSDNSHGFRKGRGCHSALDSCLYQINSGQNIIIDLDIKSFFDTVDHAILMERLRQDISDRRLLEFMQNYIKMDIVFKGHKFKKYIGIVQGSSLSPLLANIYLDSFDSFIEKMGEKHIRYADDIILFCDNFENAKELLGIVRRYLRQALHIELNIGKSKIVTPDNLCFLGYGFEKINESYVFSFARKRKEKIQKNMKKIVLDCGISKDEMLEKLGAFNRGWLNYYIKVHPDILRDFLCEMDEKEVAFIRQLYIT